MKKDLLFVMNNLHCGGAEKALISLLQTIDYSKYNVDLLLFKQEGLFLPNVPPQVRLLTEPEGYTYFDMSIQTAVKNAVKRGRFQLAVSRIQAGFVFRTEHNRARCEQRVWPYMKRVMKRIDKTYDAAIGYLEKTPIYFCVDKVRAAKKIGFIHTDYDKMGMDANIDAKYVKQLDYVVTVSQECAEVLKRRFPMYESKIQVMQNIISPSVVHRLSHECTSLPHTGINIVSVGRLSYEKGMDLAVEACRCLVERGYDVTWRIIGDGAERAVMERKIEEYRLQRHVLLLGLQDNPYPYVREADIYVQPSRFEGKSIAIDEAKILQKPIVVTDFPTAKDQIVHEQNGLVVEMNAQAICGGVQRLIDDEQLRERFTHRLSLERQGTEEEIHTLYQLVES